MGSPFEAAVAAARELGLAVSDPVVLRDRSNLLIHLRPAPVVARVATATAVARPGGEGIVRELAVAGALAAAGAAVVAPSALLPPGPHRRGGFALSFWEWIEPRPGPVDAFVAGARLRECHEALAAANIAGLEEWGALREAEALVAGLGDEHGLDPADVELLRATGEREVTRATGLGLPLQPVHGDAHLRNVLTGADGPLWNDWEDSFRGPRGWDLACFFATLPPFDTQDPALAGQAYRGYGEPLHADVLRALVGARRFQMLAWGAAWARDRDPAEREWFATRMAALRERNAAR
ncbi:phosphotransferase [Conexibacter sp. JD483]|uniref:phosphotransferase family protein n=1 Tax=unclassified Conexibacter TaxID=2627773 RepID=UPI002728BCD9|nr:MULTISPECIES: phosphotransferase [unclassified Conexibacter]MDO8185258.1 phosphotransferase [Conexibacter sp. CPCC 205706]MDO8198304.1 phosphotransferase [Conexibacter sp. CPCC 205762]MDR9367735.1 phosphotransferase [Conexibacter sp. JD483]